MDSLLCDIGIGALWVTQDDLYMTWDAESELTPMYRAFTACEKEGRSNIN
jgi:hypothetical protein